MLKYFLGIQYLFEILQTSLTVKSNEHVVKSGFLINVRDRERQFFSKGSGIITFLG